MRIIILGGGQVGGTLAEHLAGEENDITIVDTSSSRLRELQDRLDVRTLNGSGSHPQVLAKAGAEDADMLVAVTNSDEINMIACQVAYSLFNIPTRIARVREPDYLTRDGALFSREAIPVDVLISPESLVTRGIKRLLQYPGALQVLDFADGKVQLVAVKARYGGALVGQRIAALREHLPGIDMRVAAIFRKEQPIMPHGDTVIEAEDEVFFIAARSNIRLVMAELRRLDRPYKRIIIAGGGNIGARLALSIERKYQVKIIEQNLTRCEQLSQQLLTATILHGSASNRELLIEENIEATDVFLALTNDDEANVMASMLAKKLGARTVITLINNPAYVDLVQGGLIDIALSPQQSTISALLTHVRRGDVVAVHSLRRGAAEALEAIAHGDMDSSRVVGRRVDELPLPAGATVGALVRGEEVIMAHHDTVITDGDHVILFVADKKAVRSVEKLFQLGFGFV
ncbi:MAG: trk system potassium uptake protein TrkA [Halopseudomonas sp.]|jgi:trk system potassium uptake protein TrkA|uniref:Trk system potassium transporter TrkA n=1 Tax=Halopseudomonas sp. TaxID=2901191 RepID=UPI0039E36976